MDLGLADRSAVVLASTSGLGLAVAQALLAEGARVAISGREPARLARVGERLSAEHPDRVLARALDVTDGPALTYHLEEARDRFGAVDILVTNSGGPPPGNAAETSEEDLDRAYQLLLKSAVRAIRVVLPWMRARKYGRILAMTSSSVRQPIAGLALSNSLRAGLTGWLKTLAGEVARDGVLVNSICTGMFDTERLQELFAVRAKKNARTPAQERALLEGEIPVGRIGRPEEFGALVAFLASERASFITGCAVSIDGGAGRALL